MTETSDNTDFEQYWGELSEVFAAQEAGAETVLRRQLGDAYPLIKGKEKSLSVVPGLGGFQLMALVAIMAVIKEKGSDFAYGANIMRILEEEKGGRLNSGQVNGSLSRLVKRGFLNVERKTVLTGPNNRKRTVELYSFKPGVEEAVLGYIELAKVFGKTAITDSA